MLSSFIKPQVGMLTVIYAHVSGSELEDLDSRVQLTPPGMNVAAMNLPPGGVTCPRPVELVGSTRMTSRMAASRKDIEKITV